MNAVPKLTIVRDRKYLDWLHEQPCLITGVRSHDNETVDPAHIGAFKGMKRGDNEVLPILHRFHAGGHGHGEISMFRQHLPDWVLRDALRAYAREMYADYLASLGPMKGPHTIAPGVTEDEVQNT